jgi:hypothetical protein
MAGWRGRPPGKEEDAKPGNVMSHVFSGSLIEPAMLISARFNLPLSQGSPICS